MNGNDMHHRAILQSIAHRAMIERGLLPDFSSQVISELSRIQGPASLDGDPVHDLRGLLWASIDNDDSRTSISSPSRNRSRTARLRYGSPWPTSIRSSRTVPPSTSTPATTPPPSTPPPRSSRCCQRDCPRTSRRSASRRIACPSRSRWSSRRTVRWWTRRSTGRWFITTRSLRTTASRPGSTVTRRCPQAVAAVPGLDENLRLQDRAAQAMKEFRHVQGALSLRDHRGETGLRRRPHQRPSRSMRTNRAKDIIEDFMIAANGVTARYLSAQSMPCIRRVVRTPKRWDRIVEIAARARSQTARQPDSKALEDFLEQAAGSRPASIPRPFPLGHQAAWDPANTSLRCRGRPRAGHFGLAVKDYAHSTAPNRRFTDLVTQRL